MPAAADGDLVAGELALLLGEYAGRLRPAASGPERCIIAMKYSRSGPIVASQVVGCCWYAGRGGGGAWVEPGCG
ncbi:hypothetical protein ACRAWF_46050 [Streptomyces sp. L7]